jgi:hypothetical protein
MSEGMRTSEGPDRSGLSSTESESLPFEVGERIGPCRRLQRIGDGGKGEP